MSSEKKPAAAFSCPIPIEQYPHIMLAHGGGGRLSHQLIEKLFLPAFGNPALEARHDGALIELPSRRLAFTTDSYVVQPLFFPGGDIGSLAVNGTVNDGNLMREWVNSRWYNIVAWASVVIMIGLTLALVAISFRAM